MAAMPLAGHAYLVAGGNAQNAGLAAKQLQTHCATRVACGTLQLIALSAAHK